MNTIYKLMEKMKEEKIFAISLLLAIFTSFLVHPEISYINFKVILLLFNLMIVISAFQNLKIMDKVALAILSRCKNTRMVSMVFVILTFFASMVVTNDVALLTFIPLSILTFKKAKADSMEAVILQTLGANIGSSLTPMGNPQNLFLFTYYKLQNKQFFSITIPFVVCGIVWLILMNKRVLKKKIQVNREGIWLKDKKRIAVYSLLLVIIIFSVFGIIDYKYTFFLTVVCVFFMDRYLIKKVDYFLLATFICFFVFIGNISNVECIQSYLKCFLGKPNMPYFSSIILSQIISNVPCSLLVSGFTDNWREVLLGVNIGGMGTLVASLASLISYKIYVNEYREESKTYFTRFNVYNFIGLILFTYINYLYIHFVFSN